MRIHRLSNLRRPSSRSSMHALRFILSLLLLGALTSPALAAPTLLSQQGRL